jgi:hypothetical protein
MVTHPDLDRWISPDRTGEPQKLAHGDLISMLAHKAGTLILAAGSWSIGAGPARRGEKSRLGA